MPEAGRKADGATLIDAVDAKVSAVRTRSLDISFNELVDMYKSKELQIEPDFQRLFRWTEGAQSRLIESLILELPLPPIYMLEMEEGTYELIDGLQRISSYLHFRGELLIDEELKPPLVLCDCDIVPELNGLMYTELPRAIEIKLKRNFIRAEILRKEIDKRLRYYMFKRLNTGGAKLEDQEIRNCTIRLLSDDFNKFLVELSKLQEFIYCIDTVSESQVSKKYDQELALRFFAFKNAREQYKHSIGDFLTEYMESASDVGSNFGSTAERKVFKKTFEILQAASKAAKMDRRIFGSVDKNKRLKGQFSVYHFEAITLGIQPYLARLRAADEAQMKKIGDLLLTIKKSDELRDVTGGGKNDPNPLAERIRIVESQMKECLEQ